MGDRSVRNPRIVKKLETLTVRLTKDDRRYIRRIARIRRVPMTVIITEMIDAHRAAQLEALRAIAAPLTTDETTELAHAA